MGNNRIGLSLKDGEFTSMSKNMQCADLLPVDKGSTSLSVRVTKKKRKKKNREVYRLKPFQDKQKMTWNLLKTRHGESE